nr:retrotransposon protein, putative, unclassified [Tanacetum cinerariifolium]
MFKLDIEPISPRLKNNRDAHKACLNLPKPSEKLVAVTPLNKDKKVRFAEPITSSSNIPKQSDYFKTKDSNKPLLTSTGVNHTTSASGSKPLGNKKNNRITRPPSSNKKNKVEDYSRKVKSSLNKTNFVSEPINNALVKHSVRNAKFESVCAICNKCLFDANHDMCLINSVNDVNVVQIVLWYLDFRCLKHMTWNHSQLMNFISKVLGIVQFGNDQVAKTMGLSKDNLARGIPQLKFQKDHLCFALGKSKKSSHQPKADDTNQEKLYLLHMDLYGLMRVESINGKSIYCEDLVKLNSKADFGIFVGYTPANKAFRIYNRRTQKIMKTIHVRFNELTAMASEQFDPGLGLQFVPVAPAQRAVDIADSPVSTSIDQDASSSNVILFSDSVDTPMVEKNKLDKDLQGTSLDATLYRDMIGSLMYLTSSRPDLIYAVCLYARWSSKKQNSTAILSTKAEYITLSGCCAQILWMSSQLIDYGFTFNKIPLYCNNKSVIAICCNNVQHSRAKHIDVRYHFIKEKVENRIVKLYFVNINWLTSSLNRCQEKDSTS